VNSINRSSEKDVETYFSDDRLMHITKRNL
jgi:hypothetical protein